MRSILFVTCSPKGAESLSRRFAGEVLIRLCQRHPEADIRTRDLAANPPPFIDAAFARAILDPGGTSLAFQASEILLEELEQAEVVVIATPMNNYTVPAVLKAWIDQIVRIHRSFASTPAGKVGLLHDRPIFIVIASGGWFTGPSPGGTPAQPDFLTGYLRAVLSTIGLHDIRIIALEGVTRGPAMRTQALLLAREALDGMLPAVDVSMPGRSGISQKP